MNRNVASRSVSPVVVKNDNEPIKRVKTYYSSLKDVIKRKPIKATSRQSPARAIQANSQFTSL